MVRLAKSARRGDIQDFGATIDSRPECMENLDMRVDFSGSKRAARRVFLDAGRPKAMQQRRDQHQGGPHAQRQMGSLWIKAGTVLNLQCPGLEIHVHRRSKISEEI